MTSAGTAARLIATHGRMRAHIKAHERWSTHHYRLYGFTTGRGDQRKLQFWREVADLCVS